MTGRKMTRLEGMLLGALVALTEFRADGRPAPEAVLAARELVEKVLRRQRKKDPKRTTGGRRRRLAPRGPELNANVHDHKFDEPLDDGRGGKRVGERRQRARQVHIIDADSSARDVELARADLAGFFGDVLDKHHPGGY